MTKERDPATVEQAVFLVSERIGWQRMAEICGLRSEQAVRYWSDPDNPTCVTVENAARLDAAFLQDGGLYAPISLAMAARIRLIVAQAELNQIEPHDAASQLAFSSGAAVVELIAMNNARGPKGSKIRQRAKRAMENALMALLGGLAALDLQEKGNLS
ncbi:hypothetical protein IWY39_000034 [Sphingobium sp. JAI105]|uniref:hypothetical protein n=1 Tax=Sphingobium sp. JAI105 TaxID=2787715 RepID=UPI0018CBDC0E|nr:hypothetical protein [Sphingobium sp. JAI105]MBG6116230.1 hypothetical protein [Sphingobium sp. JAI105]